MDNLIVICMMLFIVLAVLLMAFAVFTIGFLFGYKREDKRIFKKKQQAEIKQVEETEKEKRAKKEWKKFLEYDGSAPIGVE